jgi:hypothetical protein
MTQPGHDHFINASQNTTLKFEPTMQTCYLAPFIFNNLIKMAIFCSREKIRSIQGYYAHCDKPATDRQGIQDITAHKQITNSLKLHTGLKIILIELAWHVPSNQYSALKQILQTQSW